MCSLQTGNHEQQNENGSIEQSTGTHDRRQWDWTSNVQTCHRATSPTEKCIVTTSIPWNTR